MTLVCGAEVEGRRVDVRGAAGRVAEIGPALARRAGEEVVEAGGGALLPGLVDHHLHLHALAAAEHSVACGPPAVRSPAGLAAALAAAPADEHGWVHSIGYVETVAGDLDADVLDRLHPVRPVWSQHRSGALWTVNSAAAARLGLAHADHASVERGPDGTPTGRLWRADDWLRGRLSRPPDLTAVGTWLARLGITDATPDLDAAAVNALAVAAGSGLLPQRVHLLGAPSTPSSPHL